MDALISNVLALLVLAITGILLLIAAGRWIVTRRTPKVMLSFAAIGLVGAFLLAKEVPPGYDAGEVERIKRIAAQFAPTLEAYRERHGAYPATLEAAGIATPQTKYGPLVYRAYTDQLGKEVYSLSMGDYFDNGFVAFWDSGGGAEWRLDT